MSRPVRVGMIGCGYFARYHLAAWKDLAGEGAELAAVCDLDPAKAEAAARQYGAGRVFTDVAAMLDAGVVDIVDIATRMDTHRSVAVLCAERGMPAIVQKPLAPNWDEAVAIVDAAATSGSFLAVHENFRFQDAPLRVAEILRSGAIGNPNWARIAFRAGPDVYANQPYFFTEERLVILDLGIHLLDLVRVFMGEVEDIFCRTQRRNPRVRAEDTATMLLRHAGGGVSVVESTYENQRLPKSLAEVFLEIEGDKGAIVLDRQLNLSVTSKGRLTTESLVPENFDFADPPASIARSSVRNACAHILGAFQAGRPADVSGADNLKTFALVEAAYRSATTGRAEIPAKWPAR